MTKVTPREQSQAASMLKVQGIITLVFGGLGAVLGLILMIIFGIALSQAYTDQDVIETAIYCCMSALFIFMPHVYFVISGIVLTREPEPKTAKLITIINLIVGAVSNYIVLAFAIISLIQAKEYEAYYNLSHKA
jgi:uncharacterized membrane protein